ncbi:DUF5133 domain-containing protein [Streptomyces sp. MNP-20]|uniref:DUF5133 domain-containing protein n=1 Tax=Streptomyces sp. MNP-20 TaxID=2721165 RepID=UPI001551CBBF|nr:DUF5133 domain-containing protein [Streptomyces sp. MNP-20]
MLPAYPAVLPRLVEQYGALRHPRAGAAEDSQARTRRDDVACVLCFVTGLRDLASAVAANRRPGTLRRKSPGPPQKPSCPLLALPARGERPSCRQGMPRSRPRAGAIPARGRT